MSHEIAGWIGMILILTGYFLNSAQKLKSDSEVYQAINFFGAGGILWNVIVLKNWPVVLLNAVWVCIALRSLLKITSQAKKEDQHAVHSPD